MTTWLDRGPFTFRLLWLVYHAHCFRNIVGFLTIPTTAPFRAVRKLTHGINITQDVLSRINGSRCDLPSIVDGSDPVFIQPQFELGLTPGYVCDEVVLHKIRTHLAETLKIRYNDIYRLSCVQSPTRRRMSTVANESVAVGNTTVRIKFTMRTAESSLPLKTASALKVNLDPYTRVKYTADQDARNLLRQLRDPYSALFTSNGTYYSNYSSKLSPLPLLPCGKTNCNPKFLCPAGSALADSMRECTRCTNRI